MPSKEIDPQLPYIQVHRSVAAMAAQLAPLLGVTYQHARGGFDVLWESLADRRLLAKALALPVPMVVLDDQECRQRLQLAFGMEVPPQLVARAGGLELLDDGRWRVRGMSRYLETERVRLGKKKGPTPPPPGSHPGPTPPAPWSDGGSHPTKARGERREVRGESEEARGNTQRPELALVAVEPTSDEPETEVFEHWRKVMGRTPATLFTKQRREKVRARLAEGRSVADLKQAVDGCALTPHNIGENDTGQRWDDLELICRDGGHVERFMRNATSPPRSRGGPRDTTEAGTGPLTAKEIAL